MSSETPATTTQFVAAPRPGDFESAIALLSVLGEANRRLEALQSTIESGYLALVTEHRAVYAALQGTVSETEAALEVIARRNPQWFAAKKSVTTPYGTVKFKASVELVAADEEESIRRILRSRRPHLLRRTIELNRDLLAELSDTDLARFGLIRKAKENLTVDTKVVDLGKAVKAAEKSGRGADKAAKKARTATGAETAEGGGE